MWQESTFPYERKIKTYDMFFRMRCYTINVMALLQIGSKRKKCGIVGDERIL